MSASKDYLMGDASPGAELMARDASKIIFHNARIFCKKCEARMTHYVNRESRSGEFLEIHCFGCDALLIEVRLRPAPSRD